MELRGVTHVYSRGTPFEKTALNNVSLTVEKGEFLGLIGHTGSGKSTLVQHMNALLRPDKGTVLLDGEDIFASKAAMRAARFRVGLVFQYPEHQLFEETLRADIAFGPKNMGLRGDELEERVAEAAAFCELKPALLDRSPLELSGGQKRRAAIAGILAMRPELLILDEPGAGLDPRARETILRRLDDWRRATGAAVVLVTHDMSAAASLCGRLAVLRSGELFAQGTPREIFTRTAELESMGLDLPPAARIAEKLRALGVAVPAGLYTPEELAEALLRLRKEGTPC